jgi:hypothetical protein
VASIGRNGPAVVAGLDAFHDAVGAELVNGFGAYLVKLAFRESLPFTADQPAHEVF